MWSCRPCLATGSPTSRATRAGAPSGCRPFGSSSWTGLGYERYGVHASDWGIAVGTWLALKDARHLAGLHLTGCIGGARPSPGAARAPRPPSDTGGYSELQSTKPQTLGYGLSDSPVGLASWIVEKYHGWSDHDGDIEQVYTKDQLLTNVMIYWVTNSGPSSTRLYYESRHPRGVSWVLSSRDSCHHWLMGESRCRRVVSASLPDTIGVDRGPVGRRGPRPNPDTMSSTRRRCHAAGIFRPSRRRSCGSATSGPSSPISIDPLGRECSTEADCLRTRRRTRFANTIRLRLR